MNDPDRASPRRLHPGSGHGQPAAYQQSEQHTRQTHADDDALLRIDRRRRCVPALYHAENNLQRVAEMHGVPPDGQADRRRSERDKNEQCHKRCGAKFAEQGVHRSFQLALSNQKDSIRLRVCLLPEPQSFYCLLHPFLPLKVTPQ